MLTLEEADRTFRSVLREFAPSWEPLGAVSEVTMQDPDAWMSGAGTFGVTLRHRKTGTFKVLGRRAGGVVAGATATYHRGISFLILAAHTERNTDPVRRYLEEVGLLEVRPGGRLTFRAG